MIDSVKDYAIFMLDAAGKVESLERRRRAASKATGYNGVRNCSRTLLPTSSSPSDRIAGGEPERLPFSWPKRRGQART